MMKSSAIILTDDQLDTIAGKTAHGLITGSCRYNILGVIDSKHSGQDAGEVIDGRQRGVPIFADIPTALSKSNNKPELCVIGVATYGGVLTDSLHEQVKTAITHQMHIVNGLHMLLSEDKELAELAKQHQVNIIDIRKPRPAKALHMWSGEIANITTPRIAVLGTDCAIGKRTTCHALMALCEANNIDAQMIYTGQTGWLQGYEFGFIFDSTLNDFVSGELEYQILRCVKEANPQIIFIEGQGALRNPSGPCGTEMLLSAGAKYVVLQHIPGRKYFETDNLKTHKIASLQEEIDLIRAYGSDVIAVTLNTSELENEAQIESVDVPMIKPREEGFDALLPIIKNVIGQR